MLRGRRARSRRQYDGEGMTGSYEAGGARLAYSVRGAGVPVVFLHPTPIDGFYWQPMLEELGGVRGVVPDLRGHGASELGTELPVGGFVRVPDAPVLTMERHAKDVLALMDHLQLDQAVWAGCSIGGSVVMELWRQAPERALGLAIICTKPQADAEANLERRVATIAAARAGETENIFNGMAHSLVGQSAQKRRPEIVAELRARMTIKAETLVAVQAGLATRPNSVPTLATMSVPVLAIMGGEDPGTTRAEMEVYNAAPGGCEFHLMADAGHFAAYEQPGRVAALMAEWLRRRVA